VVNRNFLNRSYPTMKKHNPYTPIMIREASGIEPRVYARFGA
jgi:NADH dehydrogenase (ubiquinone) 1 alpha subcomplex subunit 2